MLKTLNIITGIKLASVGYKDDSPKYKRKQQWKISFHTLLNPIFSTKWFKLIKSPDFEHILQNRPRIYIKPFRPYISTKWTKNHKVKTILDTYNFLKEKNIINEILTDSIIIANINIDNQDIGFVKLEYDDRFRKEGELVLTFECTKCNEKISSVAFSFEEKKPNNWNCLIGCVQGYSSKANFKQAQKLLYGMRPNSFIIFTLQKLIKELSCNNILCASNLIQVNRKKHFINIQKYHKISFNYNEFYEDSGAIKETPEWYSLPITPKQKSIDDVKSKKRNLYKKRYKLLDDISLQIKNNINNFYKK